MALRDEGSQSLGVKISSKPRTVNSNIGDAYKHSQNFKPRGRENWRKRKEHRKKEARFMHVFSVDQLLLKILL